MRKFRFNFIFYVFFMGCLSLTTGMNYASADEAATLKKLEKIIQQQQLQIEAQAKAIKALQEKVGEIKTQPMETKQASVYTEAPKGLIKSRIKNADVTLYGQVNRGVLYVDDGDDTNFYQVDNDNSSTRIGITGVISGAKDLDAGTKIEVQFESNSSSEVDQNNKRNVGDNHFTKRHLDLYLNSKQFGKLSIGYGSTASDGTSETDLSGTDLVGYSSVADMAGGQFFYDKNADVLSTTRIGNSFSNMDGLGRDDRIRYDTPSFSGFSAAASYIADGGGDFALRYAITSDRFKLAAAAAYANPGSTSSKTDDQFSASISVLHDNGISLTGSGGTREYKDSGDGDGVFFYTKLGYQADFFSIGKTAISFDYGMFDDVAQKDDEATTFGVQFVQYIESLATECYLGYRHHELDRNNEDYDDIDAVMSGVRIKF